MPDPSNCKSKSWSMEATVSAITTATPYLCLSSCPMKPSPSSRWTPQEIHSRPCRAHHGTLPRRIAPRCPHFGVCGGCNYQHIPYELQLRYKTDILRETLSRLGRVAWDGPSSPMRRRPFAYRNRAQWKIVAAAAGATRDRLFRSRLAKLCPVRRVPHRLAALAETLSGLSRLLHGQAPPDLREVEALPMPTTRTCF